MPKSTVSPSPPVLIPSQATPAARYQAACEALRTHAFPAFDQFSTMLQAQGRRVSWRAEFENVAYPSVRVAVADRDGLILDASLVLDLRDGEPRLFWLVTPRSQGRYAYRAVVPEGVAGMSVVVVSRGLTHRYTAALVG
jgi:hypothetical protein